MQEILLQKPYSRRKKIFIPKILMTKPAFAFQLLRKYFRFIEN